MTVRPAGGTEAAAPLVVLDLDADGGWACSWEAGAPVVGVSRAPSHERDWARIAARSAQVDLALVAASPDPPAPSPGPQFAVAVDDVDGALARIGRAVSGTPLAAAVLVQVLRAGDGLDVGAGLVLESAAYSMLLAGAEFRAWRERTPRRPAPVVSDPVRLERDGGRLTITLDHPARRNAYSRFMRDALVDALELAALDPSIDDVVLAGAGPAFCSGGDLDEFGSTDVAAAHLIRVGRSAGLGLHRISGRVTARLHGACIGAGIELPAFAGRVEVAPDTRIRLPELAMGLIPGAGGTVSLPRRIGRWRTAYLALTGQELDAATAVRWGLADAVRR